MHVMAINGSPRKEKSSTYHILSPLLEGMRAAGATTELVNLGHLQIRSCLGCFLCWVKTPGKCVQEDDMAAVSRCTCESDRRTVNNDVAVVKADETLHGG